MAEMNLKRSVGAWDVQILSSPMSKSVFILSSTSKTIGIVLLNVLMQKVDTILFKEIW